jgi:hypothetical protein
MRWLHFLTKFEIEAQIVQHPVRLSYSAESAAIQQCFSLTTNQQTVVLATINQRNEQATNSRKTWITFKAALLLYFSHAFSEIYWNSSLQHYITFAGLKSAGNLYLHPVSRGSTVVCSVMDTPKSKREPDHLLILVHGIMAR